MSTVLAKLEAEINRLEGGKDALFELVGRSSYEYEEPTERLPATDHGTIDMDLFSRGEPERAPFPAEAGRMYQRWSSSVRAILARNQPGRLGEYDELYVRVRDIASMRYVSQEQVLAMYSDINAQYDILAAVPYHLRAMAFDVELEAYSILMEDELDAAQHLLSRGFLRPAGALAGVILERHLKNLLRKHDPPVTFRKTATLGTINELCKEHVYDQETWRYISWLTDLRNLCSHDKQHDPNKNQVSELIMGVTKVLKNHPS